MSNLHLSIVVLTKRRAFIAAMFLALTTLACSLGGGPAVPATLEASATVANDEVPTLNQESPTQSEPTQSSVIPTLASGNPSNVSQPQAQTCMPRTEWLTYRVQFGDTLYSLAQRTYISVPDLAAANCQDVNTAIQVNQTLYVPRAPLNAPPANTAGGPTISALRVIPSSPGTGSTSDLDVLGGQAVSLQVEAQNAVIVTFYAVQQGNPEHVLGTAVPNAGTATLTWQIPSTVGQSFFIRAEAVNSTGQSASSVFVKLNIATANAGSTPLGSCPALTPRLFVGGSARVTPGDPNVVRSKPTRDNSQSAVLGQMPGGATFVVVSGPQCAEGFYWWQVNYNGLVGWTPEGQNSTYWLEPLTTATPDCPGVPPAIMAIGQTGVVTPGDPNLLRAAPAKISTNIIGKIPSGGTFTVVGGPQCADGLRFWQVTYNGQTGWTADGQGSTYWLMPQH